MLFQKIASVTLYEQVPTTYASHLISVLDVVYALSVK